MEKILPAILLKAKDFATEITIYNARENNMSNEIKKALEGKDKL